MKLDRHLGYTEQKYLIWNFSKTLGLTPLTWHLQDFKMTTNLMKTSDFTSLLKDRFPSGKISLEADSLLVQVGIWPLVFISLT